MDVQKFPADHPTEISPAGLSPREDEDKTIKTRIQSAMSPRAMERLKCWDNPCTCGYEYRNRSPEWLRKQIIMLQKLLEEKESGVIPTEVVPSDQNSTT